MGGTSVPMLWFQIAAI
ncbi:DUF6053 domain-containing protein [Lysobacter enzymogenes]